MKATGIIRKIDSLGRIVIAKELRDRYGINEKTPLELFIDENNNIIFRKYVKSCDLCGKEILGNELYKYKKASLCKNCLSAFSEDKNK